MAVIDRVAAHQGWPLRGVPLYLYSLNALTSCQTCCTTQIDIMQILYSGKFLRGPIFVDNRLTTNIKPTKEAQLYNVYWA